MFVYSAHFQMMKSRILLNHDLLLHFTYGLLLMFRISLNLKYSLQVDESPYKDSNRQKLRGTGQVFHLTCLSNPNDLAAIFELDPTSAQRVDDMVPKYAYIFFVHWFSFLTYILQ